MDDVTLASLSARAASFTDARDWRQFHDPKSLILALVGEVGELAELFQWRRPDEALDQVRRARVGEEMADVLIYLLHLTNALGIDLAEATIAKMDANEQRFTADRCLGNAPVKE